MCVRSLPLIGIGLVETMINRGKNEDDPEVLAISLKLLKKGVKLNRLGKSETGGEDTVKGD